MRYKIELKEQAKLDVLKLAKHEKKAFLKVQSLIEELKELRGEINIQEERYSE